MARIFGSKGTGRRRVFVMAAVLGSAFLLFQAVAYAVLPGSPSNFESGNDPSLGLGNMIVNTTGDTDWISVTGDAAYFHGTDAAAVGTDDSFTPGQKQDTTCPTVEGHKNPPKDDFTDVASFFEVASNGDVYLYGATIRYTANGNASENIELKQSSDPCPAGSATLTQRTAGDKLLAIDYLGGGKAVQFHVLTWVITGACNVGNDLPPCWGATVLTLDPNVAEGGVNTTAITAPQNPISGVPLVAGQFAEFGVNLTDAGIIPPGSCEGFAQTVWESRSSGSSFVSSTKDIVIEDKSINQCAQVSVRKIGSDGLTQEGVVFTLYEGPDTTGTAVGTCTVDANGDCLPKFTGLNPGEYTLDETNTPPGYTKDPLLPFTFTLAAGDDVSFEFTNELQNGAIAIVKTAKHADPNSSPDLVAGFTITDSAGDTHSVSTDGTGNACVDGLPPGAATVSETGPPAGYNPGPDVPVTVVAGTTCAAANGVLASFANIPLTDITVSVDSQVDGGTSSTIECDDPSHTTGSTGANGDGSVTASDLVPGTYTCVVVIDP